MTGLVLKDILVLRKSLRTYLLFLIFYFIMALLDLFSIAFITAFVQVIVMILPMSSFAYDEQAKWDRYAMTLPLGRRAVVGAKYIFVVLMILVAATFALLSCVALSITAAEPVEENLLSGVASLSVGLLAVELTLPLNYKLGAERARPFLFAIIFIPVILFVLAARAGWLDGLDQLSPDVVLPLLCLIPLLLLLGLPVSYLVSCRIVEQKEF
ncbi:ABC-2 transporter permease [Pseudoflavonifractor sp. AF19-9AC]|uniref:ABC-2 transporter permease n=1 Tax=Pseudoflavonifractor sp. AF19-9AC TaxID=2292244 RepID=UPI000E5490A0|nr:ABC-2 transporter permease [Pseudoflavonifractor sp. AF19-9AC]RHR06693.1 ABC-2 transporter permease [Pseudoflavonifractor sp. AF19-9AC]